MAGEVINHFNGVRIRVLGTGLLRLQLKSLSATKTTTMVPITMTTGTNIQPRKLANFMQQRALLRGYTTDFGDNFVVTRIVIFVKPVFGEFPQ
jgi:hypothetical protein